MMAMSSDVVSDVVAAWRADAQLSAYTVSNMQAALGVVSAPWLSGGGANVATGSGSESNAGSSNTPSQANTVVGIAAGVGAAAVVVALVAVAVIRQRRTSRVDVERTGSASGHGVKLRFVPVLPAPHGGNGAAGATAALQLEAVDSLADQAGVGVMRV